MKTKKLSFFLIAAIILTMLFTTFLNAADASYTAEVTNVGTFTFTAKKNSTTNSYEATIIKFEPVSDSVKTVEIPEKLKGSYYVTAIGNGDNNSTGIIELNSSITKIIIPSTVTTIYPRAFHYSSGLKTVQILSPSKLTKIGASAFMYCSALESINLPEGLLTIGNQAFRDCSSLKSITIPSTVTNIGRKAFYRCKNLTNIVINGNPEYIDSEAFPSGVTPKYETVENPTEQQEPVTEASTEATTLAATTQTEAETESDDETVEMPTEEETEPTTFIYDNNGFAGYYDDMGNYIEVYQPCEYDSENNAYHITNAGNLYWFADYINSSLGMDNLMGGILDNDITVNWGKIDGTNPYVRKWIPIGAAGAGGEFGSFAGVFNGNSHIINGLYCASDDENIYNYSGLFGYLTESAKVMNVCVENSYFKAASTGAVAASSNGSMENCLSVNNTIVATINAGGVLGVAMENSSIDGCFCMDSEISMHFNGENVPFANGIIGYTANIAKNCLFHNVKITKETGEAADRWNGVTEIPDGDANLDGKVNSIDAIASQWLTYSQYNIASCAADMNNDHIINEADTAYILKAIFTQDHSDEENEEESTQQ